MNNIFKASLHLYEKQQDILPQLLFCHIMLCIESSGHSREKDACSLLHALPHPMITSNCDTDLSDRLYDLGIIIFLDRLRHRS